MNPAIPILPPLPQSRIDAITARLGSRLGAEVDAIMGPHGAHLLSCRWPDGSSAMIRVGLFDDAPGWLPADGEDAIAFYSENLTAARK